MTYRIKGTLKLPSGQPAAGVDIEFISRRNYSPLLMDLSSVIKTTQSGAYDITLEYGEYAVVVYWGCNQPSHIGKLFVYSDTATGLDLQTLLQQSDWQPATPEYIQQIQDWLAQANTYASQAAESAVAAKASENAVEADRAEVASNKTIVINAQSDVTAKSADVSTKAEQVATKAEQVAANTVTVSEKTDLATAAADTASQKAASAAESDASARDAATRAENAALAMAGAILDGGQCDLSSGFYPQPLTINGKKYSTVWYIKVGGVVGGISYDAGDKLQHTTAEGGFYFRIDARDEVVSVNGEKGAVTLNAQKVGADPAGTAAASITQHAEKAGAHTINGVSGLSAALDSKLSSNAQLVPDGQDLIAFLRNTKTTLLRTGAAVLNAPKGWIGGDIFVIDHGSNYRCVFAIGLDGICHSLAIYPDKVVGWVKQYGSNSIVGEVTQAGGVPTGAIIQSGENVNGRYIKYADGTLINFCRIVVQPTAQYQNFTASAQWPHSFIAPPYHVSFTMLGTDSGNISGLGELSRVGYKNSGDHKMAALTGYTYTEAISQRVELSVAGHGRWF